MIEIKSAYSSKTAIDIVESVDSGSWVLLAGRFTKYEVSKDTTGNIIVTGWMEEK